MHSRLSEADEAVKSNSELRAEAARQKEAQQQTAAQLDKARKKIEELHGKLAGMAEQEQAVADLKAKKDQALAAAEEAKQALAAENAAQQQAAQEQISQQQIALAEQEQQLAQTAQMIEDEKKQLAACEEKTKDCNQVRAAVDELDAANKQLEEERNKVLSEAETLRAQVIGLEKIVEERSSSLAKTGKELENCKLNNEILIGQIAQGKQEPKKGVLPMPKSKAEQQQQAPAAPEQKPVQQPVQQK